MTNFIGQTTALRLKNFYNLSIDTSLLLCGFVRQFVFDVKFEDYLFFFSEVFENLPNGTTE